MEIYGSVSFQSSVSTYGSVTFQLSVSTYGRMETYGSVNFHDLIFFGSKCLKLPNSSRKVVRLRSKNFQCICLINTYEIFENQFQKFIFSKMKYAHFLFVQNVRNTGFNYKKVLGIEKISSGKLSTWSQRSEHMQLFLRYLMVHFQTRYQFFKVRTKAILPRYSDLPNMALKKALA